MKRCRSFRYRLDPTCGQGASLEALLRVQRELYNAALEERIGAWRWERRSVSRFDQSLSLKGLRGDRPDVLRFGVTVCQGTLARLDRAFAGFYRRCRAGQTPGFPRFKSSARWDSVEWTDRQSWKVDADANRLYIQGVGHVKARLHRPLRGTPKTITIKREGRHWHVTVQCAEVPAAPLPGTGREAGIDLGVCALVATSDGALVTEGRHGRAGADRLAAAQRDLARKQRGSNRRRRAVERVAAAHRKVRRQRSDLAHRVSRQLVDGYDLIAHEDLKIANMVYRPAPRPAGDGTFSPNGAAAKAGLNRSIKDAGWGLLLEMIAYKAEEAGRDLVAVNPAHTSQRCAECKHVDAANRVSQAAFRCQACGHEAHADVNAARNILEAGRALRGTSRGGQPHARFTEPRLTISGAR